VKQEVAVRKATSCASSAESQTRTGDTCIFSAVLYQLSYLGVAGMSVAKFCAARKGDSAQGNSNLRSLP
jgi:hypothetical protein